MPKKQAPPISALLEDFSEEHFEILVASACTEDGFVIAHHTRRAFDLEDDTVAALASTLLSMAEAAAKTLQGGEWRVEGHHHRGQARKNGSRQDAMSGSTGHFGTGGCLRPFDGATSSYGQSTRLGNFRYLGSLDPPQLATPSDRKDARNDRDQQPDQQPLETEEIDEIGIDIVAMIPDLDDLAVLDAKDVDDRNGVGAEQESRH